MKITAIETLVCHARMRNWVFVKVVTDQPGLIGWGEATLEWHTRWQLPGILCIQPRHEHVHYWLVRASPPKEGPSDTSVV